MVVSTASKRISRGRVVYVKRSHLAVMPPKELDVSANPIVESIGALSEFPLWDEFRAEIEKNREEQNSRID